MTATGQQQDETVQEDRSWLDNDVDGRPVRFWIGVGVAIAVVTLGSGGWWVWGLDRGMPTADAYRPLRTIVLVAWVDDGRAQLLRSADEINAAADAGVIVLDATDVVVNMPFLTWPGGQR